MSKFAAPALSPGLPRRPSALAVGLVASILLAASTQASSAVSSRTTAHTAHTLGYSGAPMHADAFRADIVPGDRMMDDATSYCMNRFKSYDPETGTFLGYDGMEHTCP